MIYYLIYTYSCGSRLYYGVNRNFVSNKFRARRFKTFKGALRRLLFLQDCVDFDLDLDICEFLVR